MTTISAGADGEKTAQQGSARWGKCRQQPRTVNRQREGSGPQLEGIECLASVAAARLAGAASAAQLHPAGAKARGLPGRAVRVGKAGARASMELLGWGARRRCALDGQTGERRR